MAFRNMGAALCLGAAAVATPAWAVRDTPQFTSLTVFGDSLVDAGNIFNQTGGAIPPAAGGYFNGRFTNGYDYTDLLSIALFGTPTVASRTGGTNFAYGGARATTTSNVPDLLEQMELFKAYNVAGHVIDRNGLYVLNFGGNDIFAAQTAAANGTTPAGYASIDAFLLDAAGQIANGVATLNAMGVRNIFITDFPVASPYSIQADNYLTAALAGITLNADTSFYRFNTLDFLARVSANPGAFGISPFTQTGTCQSGGVAAIAGGCLGYFSFDGTHPVAAVQRAFLDDANRQFGLIAAVPEPSTWAMLIAGFALAGGVLRRRARNAAVPVLAG